MQGVCKKTTFKGLYLEAPFIMLLQKINKRQTMTMVPSYQCGAKQKISECMVNSQMGLNK